MRLTRVVSLADWRLSEALGARRLRLVDAPAPEVVLRQTMEDAMRAASAGVLRLDWRGSDERPGYFRLVAQIPLAEVTFDQFFNGRSGYRAQYYLSPEEGILYNREVVTGLWPAVRGTFESAPLSEASLTLIETSLFAPHSKVWIFDEKRSFDEAAADTINAPRWVANAATRGRKAPLPVHRSLDLKGAFIRPADGDLFIDELKLDRAWDIFQRGYT